VGEVRTRFPPTSVDAHPRSTNSSFSVDKGAPRRSERTVRKNPIYTADDSDEDELYVETQRPGGFTCQPSRIAIGKKVSRGDCSVQLSNSSLIITCYLPKGRPTRTSSDKALLSVKHEILVGDIQDLKFFPTSSVVYTDSDVEWELKPFLAIAAKKTEKNKLVDTLYSNAYLPDRSQPESRYLVIEFTSSKEFDAFLAQMWHRTKWLPYANSSHRIASADGASDYVSAFTTSRVTATSRPRSTTPKGKAAYPFLSGKVKLLVYPFECDVNDLENAAKDLTCLGGQDKEVLDTLAKDNATLKTSEATDEAPDAEKVKKIGSGTVTLTADDFLLLEPEEWLNDNLIDFALRWISRNNDGRDSHFFSTHFYTRLADHGVEAVASWTNRKNREQLNVFEKKLVFVPINKSLHWSLCVIVNPGKIKEYVELRDADIDLSQNNSELPCLLFFDSLKSHNKSHVVR
jgi:hypothetical protein